MFCFIRSPTSAITPRSNGAIPTSQKALLATCATKSVAVVEVCDWPNQGSLYTYNACPIAGSWRRKSFQSRRGRGKSYQSRWGEYRVWNDERKPSEDTTETVRRSSIRALFCVCFSASVFCSANWFKQARRVRCGDSLSVRKFAFMLQLDSRLVHTYYRRMLMAKTLNIIGSTFYFLGSNPPD